MLICVNSVDFRSFTVKEPDRRDCRPRGPIFVSAKESRSTEASLQKVEASQSTIAEAKQVEASDRRQDYNGTPRGPTWSLQQVNPRHPLKG